VQTEPWRRERARALARRIASELAAFGYDVREPAAAVVPVIVGDAAEAVTLSQRLLDAGVFCPAIRPPSVPHGTSRLRVAVMATHTDEHIDRALEAFAAAARTRPRRRRATTDRDRLAPIRRAGGVFVTGTDTGVGKTIVAASIARCLAAAGLRTTIYKPVQTGSADGADDAGFAARLSGCRALTGVVLPEPLAPSVAAGLADAPIDTGRIVDLFSELRDAHDVVVVEGAGGWLVPIDDAYTMADLAGELGLPIVVVARPALGTLNHSALTIEAARSRGADVLGVVISGFPMRPGLAERTNPAVLEDACDTELIGVLPVLGGLDVERGSVPQVFDPEDWLAPTLGGTFDRERFFGGLKMTTAQEPVLG
jgi:dethiobiotin synthetase